MNAIKEQFVRILVNHTATRETTNPTKKRTSARTHVNHSKKFYKKSYQKKNTENVQLTKICIPSKKSSNSLIRIASRSAEAIYFYSRGKELHAIYEWLIQNPKKNGRSAKKEMMKIKQCTEKAWVSRVTESFDRSRLTLGINEH